MRVKGFCHELIFRVMGCCREGRKLYPQHWHKILTRSQSSLSLFLKQLCYCQFSYNPGRSSISAHYFLLHIEAPDQVSQNRNIWYVYRQWLKQEVFSNSAVKLDWHNGCMAFLIPSQEPPSLFSNCFSHFLSLIPLLFLPSSISL